MSRRDWQRKDESHWVRELQPHGEAAAEQGEGEPYVMGVVLRAPGGYRWEGVGAGAPVPRTRDAGLVGS